MTELGNITILLDTDLSQKYLFCLPFIYDENDICTVSNNYTNVQTKFGTIKNYNFSELNIIKEKHIWVLQPISVAHAISLIDKLSKFKKLRLCINRHDKSGERLSPSRLYDLYDGIADNYLFAYESGVLLLDKKFNQIGNDHVKIEDLCRFKQIENYITLSN